MANILKKEWLLKRRVKVVTIAGIAVGMVIVLVILLSGGSFLFREGTDHAKESSRKNSMDQTERISEAERTETEALKGRTIIIDPGHGGADPGKVGCTGALEKEINLKIAKKVANVLRQKGAEIVMTRQEDEGLYKEKDSRKKVADLQARVKLINGCNADMAVSIHQNSYPSAKIRGAQVFYYTHSADAKKAAEILQRELRVVDPDNTRQAKSNETYYLLKKTKPTTVIVECGFLSNPEEEMLLQKEDYQEQMASAICAGILRSVEEKLTAEKE